MIKNPLFLAIVFSFQLLLSQKIAIQPINDAGNPYKMGFMGLATENQYAQFVPHSGLLQIKGLDFIINPQSKNSSFYFNIYRNENGQPGKVIHHVLVETRKNVKSQLVSIDFAGLDMQIPEQGLFCGIEWITVSKNKMVPDMVFGKQNINFYYPNISNKKSEAEILWVFKNDNWERKIDDALERNALDMEVSMKVDIAPF